MGIDEDLRQVEEALAEASGRIGQTRKASQGLLERIAGEAYDLSVSVNPETGAESNDGIYQLFGDIQSVITRALSVNEALSRGDSDIAAMFTDSLNTVQGQLAIARSQLESDVAKAEHLTKNDTIAKTLASVGASATDAAKGLDAALEEVDRNVGAKYDQMRRVNTGKY